MVHGALVRDSGLSVGLVVGGARIASVWITYSTITFVDFSFVDLVFFFRCF
jgi:hypothetical protein